MANSLNKVMLIGNLGANPEVRSTPGGATVANFRVACTERWKDKDSGQQQERTEWVTIVVWRGLAETVQKYLRKGSKVYVEGKLQTRSWDDKATGAKRYATEVLGDTVMFLDGANRNNGEHQGEGQRGGSDPDFGGSEIPRGTPNGVQAGADDDLPF
jgi:single-strand DNA-binding protein